MKFSTPLTIAALATSVAAAPKPITFDAAVDHYFNEAVDQIQNWAEDTLRNEYGDNVKRDEAAVAVESKEETAAEPVAEVVMVLVEVTEFVSDEGTDGDKPAEHAEEKRGLWPFGKKENAEAVPVPQTTMPSMAAETTMRKVHHHAKETELMETMTAPTPTPTPFMGKVSDYLKDKYHGLGDLWELNKPEMNHGDFLHMFDHKVEPHSASADYATALQVVTIPVINVLTKTIHGEPSVTTKTKFFTTTVSLQPMVTVEHKYDVFKKENLVGQAINAAFWNVGGNPVNALAKAAHVA